MIDLYDEPSDGPPCDSARPFVGIHFECCGVYARVYRRPEEREYVGRCPRCLGVVRLRVAAGGTHARFFRAG